MMIADRVQTDYETVLRAAAWARVDTGVLRIEGRDRVKWLHKIITADVEHLGVGQGSHGALLDPRGHLVADFVALAESESVLLLVEPAATELLAQNLRRYIVREKVQVSDETASWGLYALLGSSSVQVTQEIFGSVAPEVPFHFAAAQLESENVMLIRSARALVPSIDILTPKPMRGAVEQRFADLDVLSNETLELLRIEAGLPRWGVDFDDTTLALEIPRVLSVRVDQGCYVGQEVVARIVHRGHVNRHLLGLRMEGDEPPTPGDIVLRDGKQVGAVTSAARSPRFGSIALGYVRREAADPGTRVEVAMSNRLIPAHVSALPFS